MKKVLQGAALVLFLLVFSGCAAILVGVVLSKDSAKVTKKTSYNCAWDATRKTLGEMGVITLENKKSKHIEADINNDAVTAEITKVGLRFVRVTIKARNKRTLFADADLAAKIAEKINAEL
ncbi:MAG: hypothetical protein PHE61_06685 [Candidatus Omnitrophica bacterium]|nr:hypothetical protein [Candidatus Omnitrophota bacterium]